MLRGSNSIRVIVLAALVLAVAFSSTIGSRLSAGHAMAAVQPGKQSRDRVVQQQRLNSAWQAQLSNEQSLLQRAQHQQQAAQQQSADAKATITPPTPTPAPTPKPAPAAPASNAAPAAAAPASSGGSIQSIIMAAFASLGAGAQQWGICIAQHESGDNPNAVSPTGAEGLFQFIPSTFANTPPGQAGESIWDPSASAQAAAWMYSQGQQSQWSTNFEC